MRKIVVLFLAIGLMASTAPATALANEDGFHFSEDFRGNWKSSWAGTGGRNFVRTTDEGLTVSIRKGSHFGSEFSYTLPAQTEELYFRYYLRFEEGFQTHGSGGKLPGPAGIYGSTGLGCKPATSRSPGWSARMMWFPKQPDPDHVRVGFYTYHRDQPKGCGEGMEFNDNGLLRIGEKYCVEGKIRMNTPGSRDGVLRAWVDGKLALNRGDLAFREAGEERIGVRNFWFNIYFGGKRVPPEELNISFSDVALSSERVRCPELPDPVTSPVYSMWLYRVE